MQPRPPAKKSSFSPVIAIIIVGALSVPCIGITAAIAIPAFIGYMRRSRTAEAGSNLRNLYAGAEAYYASEHIGADGSVLTRCTVAPASTPNLPGPGKSVLGPLAPSFEALGFAPADPVYYQYEIVSVPGCGHPSDTPLYSFRAHGDLDGDGAQSLFEIPAGTDSAGDLHRSPGIFIQDELE